MKKTGNTPSTALSRQKKGVLILAAFAAVLLIAYLVLIHLPRTVTLRLPLTDEAGDTMSYVVLDADGKRVAPVTDGETAVYTAESAMTFTSSPYLYPEIPLDALTRVKVDNAAGSFVLYRDKNTGAYLIEGDEMLAYDGQSLASLKVASCVMLADERLEGTYATDASLAPYGLSSDAFSAAVTVSGGSVDNCTVLIGDELPTGAGYYAKRLDKPYVYTLPADVSVFFAAGNSYILPLITPPLSESACQYMETFEIDRGGEPFLKSAIVPEERRTGSADTDLHKLTYPAPYSVSLEKYYETLTAFVNFRGDAILETGVLAGGDEHANEVFARYGFDSPTNDVRFVAGGQEYRFLSGARFTTADGKPAYYVYSPYTDTVLSVPLENAPFLEYTLLDFINPSVFQMKIDNVRTLAVTAAGRTVTYSFEGSGKDLVVKNETDGLVVDTASFRQLFIALLSVQIGGYASPSDASGVEELAFTVTTRFDETETFRFSVISTTRSLMTLNDSAEFYCNRSYVTDIVNKWQHLLAGETLAAAY